jgi:hypothetical protein
MAEPPSSNTQTVSFMKRKNYERLEQELADGQAKARADSDERQEEIKRFWDLKEQDPKPKTCAEKQLREQKERRLQTLQRCIKLLAPEEELRKIVAELIERAELKDCGLLPWPDFCSSMDELIDLARLQDREIEYLMQFRRDWERIRHYYPEKLEDLSVASLRAKWPPHIEKRLAGQNPKRTWDRTRRRSRAPQLNSIEYQFGGAGEAAWRKSSFSGQPYDPTCLRKIIIGAPINMRELQDLFWPLGRDRFPKDVLRSHSYREGREIFYRNPAVPMTMKTLLKEESAKGKRAQGKARRIWLRGPELRIRALSGIDAYTKGIANVLLSIALEETDLSNLTDEEIALVSSVFERFRGYPEWQTEIADPIFNVLRPYLSDSAE